MAIPSIMANSVLPIILSYFTACDKVVEKAHVVGRLIHDHLRSWARALYLGQVEMSDRSQLIKRRKSPAPDLAKFSSPTPSNPDILCVHEST